jgi:hypothetical protein
LLKKKRIIEKKQREINTNNKKLYCYSSILNQSVNN